MQVQSLGQEGPLEEDMATHSSVLAWRVLWTEESVGLHRVGHDSADVHAHTRTPKYRR